MLFPILDRGIKKIQAMTTLPRPTLYHYVHCPYCIRVRMAFGALDTPYESRVLPYDDEATPLQLTGKKMLPILGHQNGILNESLDIIAFIDENNRLRIKGYSQNQSWLELEAWLNFISKDIHNLAMPYWVWTPEFSPSARSYFEQKKSAKRGPFKELMKNRLNFEESILHQLNTKPAPTQYYLKNQFSFLDICLASQLWGLYVVPEFIFPSDWQNYLKRIKQVTHFHYHADFWN
jgi:glutaredoxin 2